MSDKDLIRSQSISTTTYSIDDMGCVWQINKTTGKATAIMHLCEIDDKSREKLAMEIIHNIKAAMDMCDLTGN